MISKTTISLITSWNWKFHKRTGDPRRHVLCSYIKRTIGRLSFFTKFKYSEEAKLLEPEHLCVWGEERRAFSFCVLYQIQICVISQLFVCFCKLFSFLKVCLRINKQKYIFLKRTKHIFFFTLLIWTYDLGWQCGCLHI